jgi:cyclic pyranopterin phosphate synthase
MPAEGIKLLPREHIMRNEEIVDISRIFTEMGVNKIRLTGGEPLMRKGLDNILAGLAELPATLTMTTNAILLDQNWDLLQKAGISSLNISLDSLIKKRMNEIVRRDRYDLIMKNIDETIKRGFHTKINVVLMKGVNDDELENFVEWTLKTPVHVRFIEFMPFSGNNWDWQSQGISYKKMLGRIELRFGKDRVEKLNDRKNNTAKSYRIKGAAGTFAVISTVSNPFCDTCNRIRVTADGKMKNCLFSHSETDLLTPYRAGEDLKPIILDGIYHKKAVRGGMNDFSDLADPEQNQDNRSMIRIGG